MGRKYGVKASSNVQRRVARMIRERGVSATAHALGIGEASVARIAAGGAVLSATLTIATRALDTLASTGTQGSTAA